MMEQPVLPTTPEIARKLCAQMNHSLADMVRLTSEGKEHLRREGQLPAEFVVETERLIQGFNSLWPLWKNAALIHGVSRDMLEQVEHGLNQIRAWVTPGDRPPN